MKKTITKLMIATLLCGMMTEAGAWWSSEPLLALVSWPFRATANKYNNLSLDGQGIVNGAAVVTVMVAPLVGAVWLVVKALHADLRYCEKRLNSVKRHYRMVIGTEAPTTYDNGINNMELGVTVLSAVINHHLESERQTKKNTAALRLINSEQAFKIRELQNKHSNSMDDIHSHSTTSPKLTALLLSTFSDSRNTQYLQRQLDQTKKKLKETQKLANFWKQGCSTPRKDTPPAQYPDLTELLRTHTKDQLTQEF